jgi:hypothetical protein
MKLRIGDQIYDYHRALQEIGMSHLLELQQESGVGRRTIAEALDALDDANTRRDGESDGDFLARAMAADQDPKILRGFPALIFVCKRHAKEPVTVAEAGEVGFGEFQFVPDEVDVEVEPDPTTASGGQSQPDAETPNGPSSSGRSSVPTGSRKKSKTSKATSTGE